ncbi:MAG: DUF5615 family PIN-like protein [Desulfobacterales bacterium]
MHLLYSNENFPFPVIRELRKLGHDILTIQETGMAGNAMPDEAVLSFAAENGRILLTMNRKHFFRLHKINPDHSGIVACTFDPDFKGQAQRIHDSIRKIENMAGQLIRVNRPSC